MENTHIKEDNEISRDQVRIMYPIFSRRVGDRLAIGAEEYGDKSFLSPGTETLNEIAQELLDVAGWAFILWSKVQSLTQKVEENVK